MGKKIDITDEKKMVALSDGTERTVYRIKALRDFGDVKTGQLGGWIEKESNLSHDGNCFVYDEAVVCDDAKISQSAIVKDSAVIMNNAKIGDYASVMDRAIVRDNAVIQNYAQVQDEALVAGNSVVEDRATIKGMSFVNEEAKISGSAIVMDDAVVKGSAIVRDKSVISGNAKIEGKSIVQDYVQIGENAMVRDNAWIKGNTMIKSNAIVEGEVSLKGNVEIVNDEIIDSQHFMDVKERIGIRIAKVRNHRGLSTRQLAEKSGISFANIGKLERGTYNISIEILDKLCEQLGLEIQLVEIKK